jgi:tetratricopeptide (TPR) repeat protein
MLYDVLPPLVFFGSLGGIILIVFRVVLRIRKEQFASNVQAAMHRTGPNHTVKSEDLAKIIGPNNKSVQVIRNRVALIIHNARSSATQLTELVQWRARQKEIPLQGGQFDRRQKILAAGQSFVTRAQHLSRRGHLVLAHRARALKDKVAWRRRDAAEPGGMTAQTIKKRPQLSIMETAPDTRLDRVAENEPGLAGREKATKMFGRKRHRPALTQAREALNAADYAKAESVLVPYLAKHPKETTAYMLLGEAAMVRRDWDEAMEIFEQVIRLNPRVRGSFAALGRAAFEAGKFTRAIEALQRAHDAAPRDVGIINRLIKIASRMDNVPMQKSLRQELLEIRTSEQKLRQRQSAPGG